MTDTSAGAPKASGRKIVLVAGSTVAAMLTAAFIAFFFIGRERFERNSRMTEAHSLVALLARGIADCSLARTSLPPTSEWRTGPVDAYGDEAFKCARFVPKDAQTFEYAWEQEGATAGTAKARGDLDGDGHAESGFLVKLVCVAVTEGLRCSVGPVDPIAIARPR